jgi:hypothetical protein
MTAPVLMERPELREADDPEESEALVAELGAAEEELWTEREDEVTMAKRKKNDLGFGEPPWL